jgi:MYXO-CTERM domain-containing protein
MSLVVKVMSAILLALVATAAAAQTGNPTAGQTKYNNNCAACHGVNPANPLISFRGAGTNAAGIRNAINSIASMNTASLRALTNQDLADIASYIQLAESGTTPGISVSPSPLSISGTTTTPASGFVTVTSNGTSALILTAVTVTGAGFARDTAADTCQLNVAIAVNSSCRLGVRYTSSTPVTGAAGTLVISHNAPGNNTPVNPSANITGNSPTISFTGGPLTFPATNVGAASTEQLLTVSNTGTGPLSFTAIGTSNSDFRISAASTTCAVGTAVAAGANCRIGVTFNPTAPGARSGNVSITHNATGSPSTVALSGTGNGPGVGYSANAINFGSVPVGQNSANQVLTITNNGNAALNITQVNLSNAAFSVVSQTCTTGSVAAGGTCTVTLRFSSNTSGAANGNLTLTSNAAGAGTVTLTANATPSLTATSGTSVDLGSVVNGSRVTRTVTLAAGTSNVQITSIAITGPFTIESTGTCTRGAAFTLNAGTSCTVDISFTASTLGANTGSLAVTATPAGNSLTVALSANVTQPAAAGGGGGGGGCSVSGQHGAADPTLLVLALLSLALLMARRRRATI